MYKTNGDNCLFLQTKEGCLAWERGGGVRKEETFSLERHSGVNSNIPD